MDDLAATLTSAVDAARALGDGAPAAYIPELAQVDPELTSAAVTAPDGRVVTAGDVARHRFTLQSSAKVVLLAALLEELGPDAVFATVGTEPSGGSFAAIARLETHGPRPANPLVNAGAIALCGLLRGHPEEQLAWLDGWMARLCGAPLHVSARVLASERRTGHRNRAIAHLLRAEGALGAEPDAVLEVYFSLCSYVASVVEASHLAAVLAGGGLAPGGDARVLSARTAATVVAIMTTCGMYDESGAHLVACGVPAKSGVSGVILGVVPGRAGVAVSSPRVNARGSSVRGLHILTALSDALGWHLARP